jgi:hypothetical protein
MALGIGLIVGGQRRHTWIRLRDRAAVVAPLPKISESAPQALRGWPCIAERQMRERGGDAACQTQSAYFPAILRLGQVTLASPHYRVELASVNIEWD